MTQSNLARHDETHARFALRSARCNKANDTTTVKRGTTRQKGDRKRSNVRRAHWRVVTWMTGKEYRGPKQWIPGHGSIKQQFMDDKAYRTYLNRMAQELQTQKRHKRASLKPNTHRTANEFGTKNAAGPPFTRNTHPPSHSWKRIRPVVVSASKSGISLPISTEDMVVRGWDKQGVSSVQIIPQRKTCLFAQPFFGHCARPAPVSVQFSPSTFGQ
jgi:hypothetical protein